MRRELSEELHVRKSRITVIPFGINNAVPNTGLTSREARQRLGIRQGDKTILFFGHIAPYKGLDDLISAFHLVADGPEDYRQVIAGRPKNCDKYWSTIRKSIAKDEETGRILVKAHFIPDDETEVYFKAADVFVLPYRHVYQSGVLFLGHSFGLPALASDVGSLRDDIVEGRTGFVFQPEDPNGLARTICKYFSSELYTDLNNQRSEIRTYVSECHSWDLVSDMTIKVYAQYA
jgi:glycosyltransferase involved in cell wall biosynthesis